MTILEKHAVKKAVKLIRDSLRDLKDHHPNCSLRGTDGNKCDCYAEGTAELHEALDVIEDALKTK